MEYQAIHLVATMNLFEYRDVIVARTDYWFLNDIEDEPTWFQIFLDKGSTITP